jgi:hypothetical protein
MKLNRHRFAIGCVVCATAGALAGGFVAEAASTHTPEIDRANANIQLGGTLASKACNGEDLVTTSTGTTPTPYITYSGSWAGAEGQVLPDPTDYPLSGPLTVSGIEWTVNLHTGRGVLVGKAVLHSSAANAVSYTGTLTVVTQGIPAAGAVVVGRGFLTASFTLPDDGVATAPKDDKLLANVEFPSMSPTGATGFFGDAAGAPSIPDFSVVTNVWPLTSTQHC